MRDIRYFMTVDFQIGTTTLSSEVIEGQVALDGSWTPYGQGSLTLPLDETIADQIDPSRVNPDVVRAVVWKVRNLGDPDTEQQQRFDLEVRQLTRNYRNGTMSVRTASAEAAAAQWVWHDATPKPMPSTDLETTVSSTLTVSLVDGLSVDSPPISYTIPETVDWLPGQSVMDYLKPLVGPSGRKIICDEQRRWLLAIPGDPPPGAPVSVTVPRVDVIEHERRSSVDSGRYADDVLFVYEWTDTAGNRHRRVDASPGSSTDARPVWHVENVNGVYPGPGAALALRSRLQQWRNEHTVRMLWDLSVRPGTVFRLEYPDGNVLFGPINRVTFHHDGLMDVAFSHT